jgi:hypothetical protein
MYYVCMPTIFQINNRLRVVINTNDHNPPHVHVIHDGTGAEAKIGVPQLVVISSYGFSQSDLNLIIKYLSARINEIGEKWNEIHGQK